MDSLIALLWTGEPVESVFRLLIVMMFLELFSVVCAYLGGVK